MNKSQTFAMIRIENLTKYYKIGKESFLGIGDLNLNVEKGEIFGLLGTNGAGKTTTIKMLSTLLYPSSGTAYISGYDIRRDDKEIRKIIGVIFSDQMIYRQLTGRANLEFYGDLYNVPNLDKRISELASFFDLEAWMNIRVETYSKGMKLMLALMRGMIHNPSILFMDEPTLGLDPNKTLRMREKIIELKKSGMTIILTTHEMATAEVLCDRIAILDKGKLVAIDTPRNLRRKIPGKNILEIEFEKENDIKKLSDDFIVSQDHKTALIPIANSDQLNKKLKGIIDMNLSIKSINISEPSLEKVFNYFTEQSYFTKR